MSTRMVLWRARKRLARWWDRCRAPWPVVGECHGHRPRLNSGIEAMLAAAQCRQCNGDHRHAWVAWPNAPRWIGGGPGVPVRCSICGARKCDADDCERRRHDHTHWQEAS